MGVRVSSGLINITVINTTTLLWTKSTGKRAVIKKIMWANRSGANGQLRIGYNTNAVAPVWTQVMPDILILNGADGELREAELPIVGNTPEGFITDTTVNTGTDGHIRAQATVAGLGAASVQVEIEVEEE